MKNVVEMHCNGLRMKLTKIKGSLKEYGFFVAIGISVFLMDTCSGYLFAPSPPKAHRFGLKFHLRTMVTTSGDVTVESRFSDCLDNELAPLLKTVTPASPQDYDGIVEVVAYLNVDMMSLDEEHWIAAAHLSMPMYPWTQLRFFDSESLDADQAAAFVELTDSFKFPTDVEVFSSLTESALCQDIAQYVKDYPYWTAFSRRVASKTGISVRSKYRNVFEERADDDSYAE